MNMLKDKWQVGSEISHYIFTVRDDTQQFVGETRTPTIAKHIVKLHNAHLNRSKLKTTK